MPEATSPAPDISNSPIFTEVVPEDRILKSEMLEISDSRERYDTVTGSSGKTGPLIQTQNLENHVWFVPPSMIDANPEQPRTIFRADKMAENRASLIAEGQRDEIHVVPFLPEGETKVRLLIIDGERRFRNLSELGAPYIKVIIKCKKTKREIYEDACVLNVKAPHNEMEFAEMCRKMVDWAIEDGFEGEAAYKTAANKLGFSVTKVKNFLKLLTFDAQIQEAIREGLPSSAALQLQAARRRFGAQLNVLRVARLILDHPDDDWIARKGVTKGTVTRSGVRAAMRAQLMEGGHIGTAEKTELEIAAALVRFIGSLSGLRRDTRKLLKQMATEVDIRRLIKAFRSRPSQPPEVLIEDINELIEFLRQLFVKAIKPAVEPDPIEIPSGSPKFIEKIRRNKAVIDNGFRSAILCILAEASDNNGSTVTAQEIETKLRSDHGITTNSTTIANNLKVIDATLSKLGLKLGTHEKRIRPPGSKSRKKKDIEIKKAYRLEWLPKKS